MKKLSVQAWILLILIGHHLTFVLSQIPASRWRINVGANTSGLKEWGFVLMFSVYLCVNVLLNVREFNEFCCQSLIKCQKFAKYSSYKVSRFLQVLFSHNKSLWLSKLYITDGCSLHSFWRAAGGNSYDLKRQITCIEIYRKTALWLPQSMTSVNFFLEKSMS